MATDTTGLSSHARKLMERVLMWSMQGSFLLVWKKQTVQILDSWQIWGRWGGHKALEFNPLLNIFLQHPVIYKTILCNKNLQQPPKPQTSNFFSFFFLIQHKPIGKTLKNGRKATLNNLKPWSNSLVSHSDQKNILYNPKQHFHNSDISTVGSSLHGLRETDCASALEPLD